MDREVLTRFLLEAKKNTYAKEGDNLGKKILADSSREFVYGEGDYHYVDRYAGFTSFIGQELVSCKGKIVWGMSYYGGITYHEEKVVDRDPITKADIDFFGDLIKFSVDVKQVYDFLKLALRNVPQNEPFRGPRNGFSGPYEYVNHVTGDITSFTGVERILYIPIGRKELYRLYYHGGIII